MALGAGTFNAAGGAVSDLFGGFGQLAQGDLKAKGLRISAEGTRLKAQGDLAEAGNYDLAASLARENETFTKFSTAVKDAQLQREITLSLGSQRAGYGASGLAESGSALDVLASSAQQGAISRQVLTSQGLITEAGFEEQAKSYDTMATVGRQTAAGEMHIAGETDQLAVDTENAAKNAATGSFISSAIKGVAAVASVALAPATGGLSLAALGTLAATDPGNI